MRTRRLPLAACSQVPGAMLAAHGHDNRGEHMAGQQRALARHCCPRASDRQCLSSPALGLGSDMHGWRAPEGVQAGQGALARAWLAGERCAGSFLNALHGAACRV